ncbi:MAG: hypothetical protein RI959_899 [Pseudomonadota bacterium]|jgi:uncharacterized protein
MKYLLVAVVVMLGYALWKHNRQQERAAREAARPPQPSQQTAQTPKAMVACQHCGVHLPASETVAGKLGVYCGHAHRQLAEG